jgi:uncharacterized DUF497 family protein
VAEFRWNEWNVEHLTRHGVKPEEAEDVVMAARQPYPLERPDDKWLVWGRTPSGRALQVVFVLDDDTIYVIHARDLTTREKRQYRRRRQ